MTRRDSETHTCQWCGKEFAASGRGRPKKYCSASCRQRAYEHRQLAESRQLPSDAVVISPEQRAQFKDSLYELRCAAEDVATAVADNAEPEEIDELCTELRRMARAIEHFRF
ncbi:hypothetical protein CCICO_05655 [Corynebacterium ciconiae DSM 44920]|uniref:hypothetical protein n=1 Tax=Corynebacterium ciconiae TaxID=227319 RepID=UPI0004757E25|nr:hypothetical protein [Corynebacterium ciconiae]WKD61159.1 hypothetical protein CCICO_05655 [Corynebacterium ciconiae DSM 44920]